MRENFGFRIGMFLAVSQYATAAPELRGITR